ncbi:MAG: hypothetical protein RMK67_02660 [Chloroflexota bacterium]|nr:hypothetical protein [Chloroflexota bacterium]
MDRRHRKLTRRQRRLLGEAAFLYYLSRGRLLNIPHPVFVRDRGGWALSVRRGGQEVVRSPLPAELQGIVTQPGSKRAAIVRRGDDWHVIVVVASSPAGADDRIREMLGQDLLEDLGPARALRLAARFRRYGPFALASPEALELPEDE